MKGRFALWLIAAAALGGVAFLGGRALRPAAEAGYAFEQDTPSYEAADSMAGLSRGGFSGWSETGGLEGLTVVTGRVVEATATGVTVEAPWGTRTTIRLTGDRPIQGLRAADQAALRPGATVTLRTAPDGDLVEAVLILAPP
jgi:hypothetical protein